MASNIEIIRKRWESLTDKGRMLAIENLADVGYSPARIVECLPASKPFVIAYLKERMQNTVGHTKRRSIQDAINYIQSM